VGLWARIWSAIRGDTRPVTTVELLQRAERARREGRLAESEELVARVLASDPRHVLGHLLAGYLHAAGRRTDEARGEFGAVLSLDPDHPRALLGLARVDFEAGDFAGSRKLLERALRVYPDFPEARALLDLVLTVAASELTAVAAAAPPSPDLRLARLALPEGTRECMLVQADGALLFSHPVSRTREALASHLVRLCGIATATLGRAKLGPLRRGVMASNSGTTFVRTDSRLVLALTLPPDVTVDVGQRETEGLWGRCVQELGAAARPAGG
jgi:tetratricopeptide (TPR) repeat protein